MDRQAMEYHIRGLLQAIGEDPSREGLVETPKRVAAMLEEVLSGTAYSNHEIAQMFGKTFSVERRRRRQRHRDEGHHGIQLLRAPPGADV